MPHVACVAGVWKGKERGFWARGKREGRARSTALPTLLGPRTLITHGLQNYGLYSSHDALQVPTLLGIVASVCTPLPTRTQQLPTLLAQQRWELLRPFARGLPHPNNVSIQIQSFRVDIRPMTPRNNFVFVSNRLPNLFARRPEMPLPLIPFSQESAPLKGNGTRKAFWEICPPFCPFCRRSSWLRVALTDSPRNSSWVQFQAFCWPGANEWKLFCSLQAWNTRTVGLLY